MENPQIIRARRNPRARFFLPLASARNKLRAELTTAAYNAHPVLAPTAEVTLPLLGLLCVLLPLIAWKKKRLHESPLLLWGCAVVSIALIYALRFANRGLGLGVAEGLHFSTHTGLAVSFAVTLLAFRAWLAPLLAAVLAGYFWLVVFLGYHAPGDVEGTLIAIAPLSLLCHAPWWKRTAGR